jgi:hypothetical protein
VGEPSGLCKTARLRHRARASCLFLAAFARGALIVCGWPVIAKWIAVGRGPWGPGWLAVCLWGCSLQQHVPGSTGCGAGDRCVDASSPSAQATLLGPPPKIDETVDSGPEVFPECLGVCNPDDRDSLVCRVPDALEVDAAASAYAAASSPLYLVLDASSGGEGGPAVPAQPLADAAFSSDATGPSAAADGAAAPPLDGATSGPSDAAWDATSGGSEAGSSRLDAATDAGGLDGSGGGFLPVPEDAGKGEQSSPALACQVFPDPAGVLHSGCAPSGEGKHTDACVSSRDCGAGLACVETDAGGQCLPFCCGGQDSCGAGSYCTKQPLSEFSASTDKRLLVPVCAPSEECKLGEPYPCPPGESCSCTNDNACTIVDAAGTSACVTPGRGKQGEGCPCGAGYVCSHGNQICLKLCQTQQVDACGSGLFCQPGPSGYPEGWGLCVGAL